MTTPLAATVRGEGGAPIVLIHGLTFSSRTWDPIADRLAARHRVIAVDLPGHGDSGGSAADINAVGERLQVTLDRLDVERPVVVGHSAGAMTALGFAAGHPVSGVVNVDQPLLVGPFAGMLQQLADQLRGPNFEQAFAPFEQSIGIAQLPAGERERVGATRRVRQDVVLDSWHLPMTTPPDELQAMVDGMLAAVDAPYLYVAGNELPPPVSAHLQSHLRRLQVVTWPGTGHLVHLVEPERFAALVSEFADESAAIAASKDL